MDGRIALPPENTTAGRWRALFRALAWGAGVALFLAACVEIYAVAVGGNVHEVIPGNVYRCSQPTPAQIEALVKKHGIRTVINMRGQDLSPWYLNESNATAQLDLSQEDLPFTAGRLPGVPVIRHLLQVLDHSERPILIHCRQGVDRTGMASVMVLLLYTDATLDEALGQLGPRYVHLPFGRTGNIDRFFVLYREWLDGNGWTHSPDRFRQWVEHDYCPGECMASYEILEPRETPLVMRCGEPLAVRVRFTNRSVKPWRFRPGTSAGIHACWDVRDANESDFSAGRSGLFFAEVQPHDSIDLTLAIPARTIPGRYSLRIDMVDEQHAHFHELGCEPLVVDLIVR